MPNKVQGLKTNTAKCGALFYEFIGYHDSRRSKTRMLLAFDRQWMMRVYKSLRFPGILEDLV